MIGEALIKADRRRGGRRVALAVLHEDVLSCGIDASQGEVGRAAGLLAYERKIPYPVATWGEICTGIWKKRDAA